MEWQAIVLALQILMLAVGWFLFQQAKGDLSARAAETPVLGEVKALQRSIKQLLADLEQSSESASVRVEKRCDEARRLLDTLDARLEEAQELRDTLRQFLQTLANERANFEAGAMQRGMAQMPLEDALRLSDSSAVVVSRAEPMPAASASARDRRRDMVFALVDEGRSQGDIARESGISEGEIEMLLALRLQRA